MNWRIYRMPGSRAIWHIDSGPNTQIFNVRAYRAAESFSEEINDGSQPRAWIQIDQQELHLINGVAVFERQHIALGQETVEASKCVAEPA